MSQAIRPFYSNTLLHYQNTLWKLFLLTTETIPWPPCCAKAYQHSIAKKYILTLVQIRASFPTELLRRSSLSVEFLFVRKIDWAQNLLWDE